MATRDSTVTEGGSSWPSTERRSSTRGGGNLSDQALRACAALEATKGDRVAEPFTITIRRPTEAQSRSATLPRITAVLEGALGRSWPVGPEGTDIAGVDLLKSAEGVQVLKQVCRVPDSDLTKSQKFAEELSRRWWVGTVKTVVTVEVRGASREWVDGLVRTL
jgi:hypothetical protein